VSRSLSCSSCNGLFNLHSASHTHSKIKRQVRPSATRTSRRAARAWPCPASSGRLARLVVALGAIRFAFACTGRQRASAGPQSRAATPPSLVPRSAPDRSCRAAAASSLRRAPAQTHRANEGAGARGPVCPCDCASTFCSSAVSQACVSLIVRGVGRRNSQRHRRAADKRFLLPVIWLVAERRQARTADSEREWHTQQVSAFRRGAAGAGAPDAHKKGRARRSKTRCHSASCRTRGTLAHYSHTHCCACTCRAVRASLFLLDDD
jgi:hypothetical protein